MRGKEGLGADKTMGNDAVAEEEEEWESLLSQVGVVAAEEVTEGATRLRGS